MNAVSRQCIVCRKRTGAITAYRFLPANRPQFSAYAHRECLERLRAGKLDAGAYTNTNTVVCGYCFHARHEGGRCECTRTIELDGIEIDGPCGCLGEDVGYVQ